MLFEHQARGGLGEPSGVQVTLGGGDDRPLHQDVPRPCKRFGVAEAGLGGEACEDRSNGFEMPGGCLAGRALRAHLEQHVDERSRLEGIAVKPLVEQVEDGQQLALGGGISSL